MTAGDASFRQSNENRLADNLKPGFMKSDAEKVGETGTHVVDDVISHFPGQGKARDALNPDAANPAHHATHDVGRGGLGTTGDALKPSGEQGVAEWVKTKADQAAAFVTPNQNKSTTQDLKDTVTPGHDSSLTPHGPGAAGQGVLGSVGQAVVDAKDAVVGALGGANQGAHDGVKRTDL